MNCLPEEPAQEQIPQPTAQPVHTAACCTLLRAAHCCPDSSDRAGSTPWGDTSMQCCSTAGTQHWRVHAHRQHLAHGWGTRPVAETQRLWFFTLWKKRKAAKRHHPPPQPCRISCLRVTCRHCLSTSHSMDWCCNAGLLVLSWPRDTIKQCIALSSTVGLSGNVHN